MKTSYKHTKGVSFLQEEIILSNYLKSSIRSTEFKPNGLNKSHCSVYSEYKCAIVERFNRTLKTQMFRSFTASGKEDGTIIYKF